MCTTRLEGGAPLFLVRPVGSRFQSLVEHCPGVSRFHALVEHWLQGLALIWGKESAYVVPFVLVVLFLWGSPFLWGVPFFSGEPSPLGVPFPSGAPFPLGLLFPSVAAFPSVVPLFSVVRVSPVSAHWFWAQGFVAL